MKTIIENFEILVPRFSFGRKSYTKVKLSLLQTHEDLPLSEVNWLELATMLLSQRKQLSEGQEIILTQDDCLLYVLLHNDVKLILLRGNSNEREVSIN